MKNYQITNNKYLVNRLRSIILASLVFVTLLTVFAPLSVLAVESTFTTLLTTTGLSTLPPPVPTNFLATAVSSSQIDLSWTASVANFYSIAGYRIFRDSIFLATTSSTVYSDTGLTELTAYSYTIEAFDTIFQMSGQSATTSATTTATPTPTPVSGGGSGSSGTSINISNIKIVPGIDQAEISFDTNVEAQTKVQWGFSKDFEIGSLQNLFYGKKHTQMINGLVGGLTYQVRITASDSRGRLAYKDLYFTTILPDTEYKQIPNPTDFLATAREKDIKLTWTNPTDPRFNDVRIVRAEGFYPIDQFDGIPLYEGDGESFVDTSAKPGVIYYYAIFARDRAMNYSSGALAQARIAIPGEVVVPPVVDPFANLPQAKEVDPMIQALTLADFEFIQDGKNLEVIGETVAIHGDKNLTIRLKYNKVPEILKTVAFTLQDPSDPSKAFPFLLRINSDKTYYEATIGALGRSGRYSMSVAILDYENNGLKRINGTLAALAFSAPFLNFAKDFDILGLLILLLFIILIILAIILLRRWVYYHPEFDHKPAYSTHTNSPSNNARATMRKFIASVIVITISALSIISFVGSVYASFNPEINYQGKLVSSTNSIVPDGNYNIRFKLYTSLTGGSPIWTETWCNTSDCAGTGTGNDIRIPIVNGLFSTMLGSTTAFTGVDFDQPLYLSVEIGGSGATAVWDGEMSPRKILGAVPAAFYAGTSSVALSANTLDGLDSAQFFRNDTQNATSSSSTFLNIIQTGAGKIAEFFGSASQSVLALLSNGNVGIGTSTPSSKLSLVGGNFTHTASGTPTLAGTYDTSGNSKEVYISGKYAYVADVIAGLQIIDVSIPSSPVLEGTYNTSGSAYGVYISGKYAYVADGGSGLQIIDISNPNNPILTGTYNTSGSAEGVYVSGKYAYVADYNYGLQIIDISNPNNPILAGMYNSGSETLDVYVSGKYAYVADNASGLKIVDISNPSSPILMGTYDPTSGHIFDVYVSGKYAYVANEIYGLKIVDISNPSSPTLVGAYNTDGDANEVYISGKYAYVADVDPGLHVIDISNPNSPTLIGTYDTTGSAYGVYVSGKYAYVADYDAGLQIIDINGIETPSLYAGNIGTNDLTVTENVDVGNSLYVRNGLNVGTGGIFTDGVLSVTGTSSSYIAGNLGLGTTSPFAKLSVAGIGSFDDYVRASYFTATSTTATSTFPNLSLTRMLFGSDYLTDITGSGLTISNGALSVTGAAISGAANMLAGFDASGNLTSTSSPQVAYINATSTTATSTFAGGLSVAGATGFNVLQNGNIGIGTSSPLSKLTLTGGNITHTASGNPTLAGTYNTSGSAYGVYVSGKYAYVADDFSGLQIVDISNPASTTLIGTYDTNGQARDVYVSGRYAYVADFDFGLQIIDISNPASPTLAGTYDTSDIAHGVYVSGKYAYVADNASGLQIINISNPASPTLTGTYNTSGHAREVYISGKYAYVADNASGLQIIDISNPASPTLTGTYDTSGNAQGVYVSGKYAYVADLSSGLQIIDISNPANPTLTGTHSAGGIAFDVYVFGKYAYIADDPGLQIIDISNPASPTQIGSYSTINWISYGIYVSGKYAYIADEASGLQIIDINGIETPSLYAGNINTNDLTVTENVDIGNSLYVRNGLNIGQGGIFTDGVLGVAGTSSSYIAGNLGLGTTSPNWKLSVAGIGSFDDYVRASYFTATSTTATSTFAGGLSVAGSSGLNVLQNGNVGIGGVSSSTLYIAGSTGSGTGDAETSLYVMGGQGGTDGVVGGRGSDIFLVAGNGGDGAMTPGGGGNIYLSPGIGGLGGGGGDTGLVIVNGSLHSTHSNGYAIWGSLSDGSSYGAGVYGESSVNGGSGVYGQSNNAGGYAVYANQSDSSGYAIYSAGGKNYFENNLGLGTTSPNWKLSVAGQGSFDDYVRASYFNATSTTATSTFPNLSLTRMLFGSDYLTDITGSGLTISNGVLSVTGAAISGASNMLAGFDASGNLTSTSSPQVAYINATSTTATSTFAGGLSVAGATGLNILQNGNIGIGTSSPLSKLTLAGGNLTHTASGNPTLVGSYGTSGTAYGVYVSGKYAYIIDDTPVLKIIDISNPNNPTLTGTYNTSGFLQSVYVSGKYAFLANYYNELKIIDISNPSNPLLTSTYDTGSNAHDIYVSGKYAYVASGSSGLKIIDISNPSSPVLIGTYNTSGYAVGVYVSGRYAHVADNTSGLQIIDISNSSNPTFVGTYDTNGGANKVYVSGKYAYVADGTSGLQIIDISNPVSPTFVGTYDTSGNAYGVYVSGKYAYVADGVSGLHVIDISSSTNPTLTGTYSTSDYAMGIYVSGKYAYVAGGLSGLQIIDINGIETPSLYAGNINTNALTVTENIDIGNSLYVRNGLNVGTGGIFTDGVLSAIGTSSSYIAGNLGLGTTSPNWKLSVAGIGSFDDYVRASYFTATSTTATSTFPNLSLTRLLFGSDYLTDITGGGLSIVSNALTVTGLSSSTLANKIAGFDSSGNLVGSSTLSIAYGGTGTSTTPTYGQLLMGDGSGNYSFAATSTLGILASSAIGIGTQGFVPYYASNAQALTATSSLFISQSSFIGIGTTTPTSALSVFSASGPQFQLAYDKDNYLNTSISSSGGVTMAVNGTAGGFSITNPQPASVLSGTGTNAPIGFAVTAGTGGNSLDTNIGVGGIGGGIQLTAGVGGTAIASTFSETGGAGGAVSITGGLGGSASSPAVDFMSRVAGIGGTLTLAGGAGGNASNGGLASSNIAGAGGAFILKGGAGGNATGATTNNGGAGGSMYLAGGAGGTGSSANGSAGNLYLGYDSSNVIGNVYFGNQGASYIGSTGNFGIGTTSPYAKLSVVGETVSTYFTATSTTASTFPYASTTALTVSGTNGLQLATGLNGLLQAVNGLVQSSSTLSIAYGGTGLSTTPSYGQLLLGNASSGYTLTSTSSLGISLSSIIGNFGNSWELTNNIFSQSSLTPTTTQNIAISGIGTSTFAGGLEAWRQIASPYFHATSTTATSTFSGGLIAGGATGLYVLQNGKVGIGMSNPTTELNIKGDILTDSPTLGAELTDATGWTSTDWTGDYNTGFTHTAGNTTNLSRTMTVSNGSYYQIAFTISGRTAGSVTVALGYATTSQTFSANQAHGVGHKPVTTNGPLVFIPTSDFDGKISAISVKVISVVSNPIFVLHDSAGTAGVEFRQGTSSLQNTFMGSGSGSYNTTGNANTAQGYQALRLNTTGTQNTVQGYQSIYSNTTGTQNTGQGYRSLYVNTTGSYNTAQGNQSLYSNTTGSYNSAQGMFSLYSNTTGSSNSAQGAFSLYSNTTGSNNSAQGYASLYSNTTGSYNSAQGHGSLFSNTTGSSNTAQGYQALFYNTTGSYNSAQGYGALLSNTTGINNSAFGYQSLTSNTTGNYNTAQGYQSLRFNTTGSQNQGNGYQALYSNTTGQYNTAIGVNSVRSSVTGQYNTGIGLESLYYNTSATNTTAVGALASRGTNNYNAQGGTYLGYAAGYSAGTGGDYNTMLGYEAGYNTSVGDNALYAGYRAGYYATSSLYSTYLGYEAGRGNTGTHQQGDYNTAIGYKALNVNTTGNQNVAIGYLAMDVNTTGYDNFALGTNALGANTTGIQNTAIGTEALQFNVSGQNNVGIGKYALRYTTGNSNTAIGNSSLYTNTSGINNVAIGQSAGYSNTTGTTNTLIGVSSGYYNASATSTTAIGHLAGHGTALYNSQGGTYLGFSAGYSAGTGGDYNTMLGYQSGYNVSTGKYNIIIGQNVNATSSDSVGGLNIGNVLYGTGMYTGGSVSATPTTDGKIGIGTTSPFTKLSVAGNAYIGGNLTATGTVTFDNLTASTGAGSVCLSSTKELVYNSGSDACLPSLRSTKHDISNLSTSSLSTLNLLTPVSFIYNQGDNRTRYGFIAEDVSQIDTHLATYNDKGEISGIDDRALIALAIGSIKELDVRSNAIASSTVDLGSSLTELRNNMTNLASSSNKTLAEAIVALDLKVQALATSTADLVASTTIALATNEDFISKIATTSANILKSDSSFIDSIANAVKNIIASAGEWVVDRFTARIAYVTRVEAETVAISKGMEIVDQSNGSIWCVTIKNGDWNKVLGSCANIATSTPVVTPSPEPTPTPSITPVPDLPTPTPTPTEIIDNNSTTTVTVINIAPTPTPNATSTTVVESENNVPTPTPSVTPVPDLPTPTPEVTPVPVETVSPEPVSIPVTEPSSQPVSESVLP